VEGVAVKGSALLDAALLGADRAGLPPAEALPLPLAGLRAALDDRSPAEALWLLAGAEALYDAAGRLPDRVAASDWQLPAYRPEGDRPVCSPAAARYLERSLNQGDAAHLPELLRLLDRAGQRAPDDLLPHLLERGAKLPRSRPALLPILGERGRWLAAMNPKWRYAAIELADPRSLAAAWEADVAGRPALARVARPGDPTRARRLIETTWRAESDAARRELLSVLDEGLSMDDEPFLERALDDRDAQVRRKAADLLAALPDSRLAGRVTAAAGGVLALKDGRLVPAFPAEITDGMTRDGIVRIDREARPAGARSTADWSRLLIQTVGVIPLTHWTARFSLSPAEVIHAARAGQWPRTLLTAFAAAALRQRDQEWSEALLAAEGYTERVGGLLSALAPDDCYARLGQVLAAGDRQAVGDESVDGRSAAGEGVVVFLRRWTGDWDEATGRALINFLARQAATDPDTKLSATLRFLSRGFALRCPPILADYAAASFNGRVVNHAWEASLRYVTTTLRQRREIWEAFGGDRPLSRSDL
jgi:hypothetical protein